jgi:ATP-binding cassette subfamily B protein
MWNADKRASKLSSLVTAKYVDSMSNFMNIKLFSRKHDERIYLNKARVEHASARQKANFYERKFWILPFSFEQICTIGIMILSLNLYQAGQMNIGDIAFTIISFSAMMKLIRSMTWKLPVITEDLSTAVQAYRDIAKPVSITDACSAGRLEPQQCRINFEDVSFKYTDDQWIFKNLNLCIMPGEKVGIVGLSGSGKSTLLYLLMRLYDVNSGAIKIDGNDLRDVTLESLRSSISFVPQDCTLFNRTLAENISYGATNAKRKDIVTAAKKAEAHDFIMRTEHGYETSVGDCGIALSGGQRQRVAIAHAICKDAPIIVMDEATSALDSKTEHAVQSALVKMLKNRTAIVVAHRLSTLRKMDRIIVLDKGNIVEQGNHTTLLKNKDGIYRKLWSMQTDGFVK